MKNLKIVLVVVLSVYFTVTQAQTEAPKGFKKGTLTLADNSTISGNIKSNIRSSASVSFLSEEGGKKQNYDGSELISAEIDGTKFICIKGDFFRVISNGGLSFLQKASDASNKYSYNGNEAVFSSGTEGKPDDYFIYDSRNKELKRISKKNFDEVTAAAFAGNAAAIDKAKAVNGDIAQLKEAVEIYNSQANR
ncbi:MAG: hypothetical protein ABI675_06455 [Chitinophagaceae bacterium]